LLFIFQSAILSN